MNFLPEDYKALRNKKNYWRMPDMKEGETKFRIIQQPIAGAVEWVNKKPIRYRPKQKPSKPQEQDGELKNFWACYVWDYERNDLFILEITQATVIKALESFAEDSDWGDFTKYDIKIKKEGTGKETRYSITPLPHKELAPEITTALRNAPVKLENLYSNGDPWDVSLVDEPVVREGRTVDWIEPAKAVSSDHFAGAGKPIDQLRAMIADKGLPISYLDQYVEQLVKESPKETTAENVVNSALMPSLFARFSSKYASEVARLSA